jgi:hypothetical protein
MEIVYVSMRDTKLSEMMALKATSEPMLMSERATVKRDVTVTAFAGTWSLGWTFAIHL